MTRRRAIGVAGVAVLALATLLFVTDPDPEVAPGVVQRLKSLDAELFYLDASEIVDRGPGRVVVIRLHGPAELVPHHYEDAGLQTPQPIERWAEHLDSPLVFNAGQFDENLQHLGWLKSDGRWLSSHLKSQWKALLLSGPVDDAAWARIADLETAPTEIEARYRHVVQSMMLVDDQSEVRVRESDLSACRTVVAEDQRGRLLVLVTEGAMTLANLARWLPRQGLDLVRAMNLDGGIESQLALETPEAAMTVYGQYGTGTTVFEGGPGLIRYPLPAVIALRPAARDPQAP